MEIRNRQLLVWLVFGSLILLLMACGGSKETLDYEPPPRFEPEPVEEEEEQRPPVETREEPAEPFEDIATKPDPVELQRIHFEFDSAELTPEAQQTLAENARTLEQNPEIDILIEGHCDERGTVEYNLALGERRALAARNYLVNYGISPDRITIISYGKERPLDPRHTPEAWQKNRRAEFVILNQQ